MKKYTCLLGFIFTSICASACDCVMPGIRNDYRYAALVFYGKFLGTDTVTNFRDIHGKPYVVDNFEVHRFYKGPDSTAMARIRQNTPDSLYILSVLNNCKSSCAVCFKTGALYLVYVYRESWSGHLVPGSCSRTRIIVNEDFTAKDGFDNDIGKNEHEELLKLQADHNAPLWTEYSNRLDALQLLQKEELLEHEAYMAQQRRRLQYLSVALALMGSYGVFATIRWKLALKNKK